MPSDQAIIQAELAARELARRSYADYLAMVTPGWKPTRLSRFLADTVQRFAEQQTGNAYDILVVECPPQHGKSMTLTEAFPSWYLGRHPTARIIEASYNEETAERFSRRNKEKILNHGGAIFGIGVGDINRATEFELNNHQGRMISRGIMSGITGNPANLLIIDDPIKNRVEADSPTTRSRIWEEWQNSLKSRLAAGAKVILIMTPWHEDDLAARILRSEHNATLLRLPVEAEEGDPMGRTPGEPLCPELGKDEEWLRDFKHAYIRDPDGGARAWSALYQCSPRVEGGNLLKRDWWRYYREDELPRLGTEIISVDAAFKDRDSNDFVAISVWGKRGNDYYCRYMMNQHLNFLATVQAIRTVRMLYPNARAVLIEDKANGSAIINVLQQEMFCIPVNPRGGKVARVNAISAAIESGHVHLPIGAPWVNAFVDQCSAFPNAAHDDMCFVAGTPIATPLGDRPIETIRPGDVVLTPFGVDRVSAAGCTGIRDVVERRGLTGTANHPVLTKEHGFVPLGDLTDDEQLYELTWRETFRWAYRKLLSSMGLPTGSWERERIISANQRPTQGAKERKGFMSLCGSFIADRQFRKAMRFITKTATLLITTTTTLIVYHAANIVSSFVHRPNDVRTLIASVRSRRSGTAHRRGESGTGNTQRSRFSGASRRRTPVFSAATSSCPSSAMRSFAITTARSSTITGTRLSKKSAFAPCVGRHSKRLPGRGAKASTTVGCAVPQQLGAQPVYNLTVERSHLYYAGGLLVHNCDSMSQALSYLLYSSGVADIPEPPEEERVVQGEVRAFLNADTLFNPYGDDAASRLLGSGKEW